MLKKPIAYFFFCAGAFLRLVGKKSFGLKLILKARRIANISIANKVICSFIGGSNRNVLELNKLLIIDTKRPIEQYKRRILILKIPILSEQEVIEKGVIIIKFSETFTPVYRSLDLGLLTKFFRVVLEPSSVGYSLPEILVWTRLSPEKIIVLSPYADDFLFLTDMATNLVPIKLGPADWVDTSRFYEIRGIDKIYDALYVANFNPIKRVERYIQAVVRIARDRPAYKAALVCAGFGSAKAEVMATLEFARMKGVSIDFFPAVKQPELNKLFNIAKVNILISLREGANKGLAEGLFSGVPALLIKENAGGNHLHINDQTGRVVPDADLEKALTWFSENYHDFNSREWAMKHISPEASTRALENKLKEIELSEGRGWTEGLFAKVNNPELCYLHENNFWLLDERAEFLHRFASKADESNIIMFLEELQEKAEIHSNAQ